MRPDLETLLISPEQEQKIKRKLPNQMPINPTAHGWSGKQIQKFLTRALFDLDGSLYSELKSKMIATKKAFAAVFTDLSTLTADVNAHTQTIAEINRIVEEIQAYFEEFPKGYKEIEISSTEPEDKTKDKLWLKIL